MNKYKVQVLTNCVVEGQYNLISYDIDADKFEIVNGIIQFITIDQIRNRTFVTAVFPALNTIVIKQN
jgi:peroxiredoxin